MLVLNTREEGPSRSLACKASYLLAKLKASERCYHKKFKAGPGRRGFSKQKARCVRTRYHIPRTHIRVDRYGGCLHPQGKLVSETIPESASSGFNKRLYLNN